MYLINGLLSGTKTYVIKTVFGQLTNFVALGCAEKAEIGDDCNLTVNVIRGSLMSYTQQGVMVNLVV